jgi:hypothetical protein
MNMLFDIRMGAERTALLILAGRWGGTAWRTILFQSDAERSIDFGRGPMSDDAPVTGVPLHTQAHALEVVDDHLGIFLSLAIGFEKLLLGKVFAFVREGILPVLQVRHLGASGLLPQQYCDRDALSGTENADFL